MRPEWATLSLPGARTTTLGLMNTSERSDPPIRSIDRILAFVSITLIAAAILCFIAIIIGTAAGVTDFGSGVWVVVSFVMYYGLPLGVVLFFILLVMNMTRRTRAAKQARER